MAQWRASEYEPLAKPCHLRIRPSIHSTSVGFHGLNLRQSRRPALRQGRVERSAYPKPIDFLGDTAIQSSLPRVSLARFSPRIAAPAVPESKHPNETVVPDQRPPVAVSREEAIWVPSGRHAETDEEYPPRWSFALTVDVELTASQFVMALLPYRRARNDTGRARSTRGGSAAEGRRKKLRRTPVRHDPCPNVISLPAPRKTLRQPRCGDAPHRARSP